MSCISSGARARLADDLHVVDVLDRPAHAGDDQRVVVGDQDLDQLLAVLIDGESGNFSESDIETSPEPDRGSCAGGR